MKKTILISILILAVSIVNAFAKQYGNEGISHGKIKTFMENYYVAYNQYAQDPATIDLMDEYWSTEFIAIAYFPLPQYPSFDLVSWKNFLVAVHFDHLETIDCDELSIDAKNMTAVSRLSIYFHNRYTEALETKVDGIGFYDLQVYKGHIMKIKRLRLFFSDPSALMQLAFPPAQ